MTIYISDEAEKERNRDPGIQKSTITDYLRASEDQQCILFVSRCVYGNPVNYNYKHHYTRWRTISGHYWFVYEILYPLLLHLALALLFLLPDVSSDGGDTKLGKSSSISQINSNKIAFTWTIG